MEIITPGIAELAGIFAADGCMQKDYLCFWGNITEDKEHYDTVIKSLFQKEFGITINNHEKKSNSVYGFYLCEKRILQFFRKDLDFSVGSKTYCVEVPLKIINSQNPSVWAAFIRGFCDTDGCLNFDKRLPNGGEVKFMIHRYPRIIMKCVSFNIIEQISYLLNKLEIYHTKRISKSYRVNEKDAMCIQISGEYWLDQWMKKISFNNPVQFSRYEIFKRHGFVPPNTSLKQRKVIINNGLDPWYLYIKGL